MSALDAPGLTRLWDAVAERLQRNGMRPAGTITLDGLRRDERRALSGLIGRPVAGDRVRVDMSALDERLVAAGSASGLVAAVQARRGPLVDRKGQRAAASERRGALWAAAREELASQGLTGEVWVEEWLGSVRSVVGRVPAVRAETVMRTAVRGLARLPWSHGPRIGRTELASGLGGSSHALDDGTVLAALVLRAIALALGLPLPGSAGERRSLWERAGVQSDEVSTTVLTLGLRPDGGLAVARAVRERSEAGCECHLTLRDLRRLDRLVAPGTTVWACENPRVLEAAMDAGTREVMVCTAGNPVVAASMLLDRLAGDGARLRYRGDFDWPGLAIANRVIGACGAEPWRMRAADYEAALAAAGAGLVELPELAGAAVDAAWDEDLAPAMARAGYAVHEELIIEDLLGDLLQGRRAQADLL